MHFLLALALLAAPAEDGWKAHYERGTTMFDLEKYVEAAGEFERAYELKQNPAFLFNIAQAYRLAGRPDKAVGFYRSYLRRLPNAANRAEVEARIVEMEKLAKAPPPGKPPAEKPREVVAPPAEEKPREVAVAPKPPPVVQAPAARGPIVPQPEPPPTSARPIAPLPSRPAPAELETAPRARHFAVRGGLGAAQASLGLSLELRPTFVGVIVGTGIYAGSFGLTFGPSANDGGPYLDVVAVVVKPGALGTSVQESTLGFGASAGWDLRPLPFLSVKLGAGVAHNPAFSGDGKPHLLTLDASIGPVF